VEFNSYLLENTLEGVSPLFCHTFLKYFLKYVYSMSFNTNRVDENYLQRLIDDLQQDYNQLFNSLKNCPLEKDKIKLKTKKIDRQTFLISKIMTTALQLKQILEEVKKIK
jgi:hypothetical protein